MTEAVPVTRIVLANNAPHELLPHDAEDLSHQHRLNTRGGEIVDFGGSPHHRIPLDIERANQTVIEFPDDDSIAHLLPTVTQLWDRHSSQPPGWVLIDHDGDEVSPRGQLIKALLESHFNIRVVDADEVTMLVTNAGLDFIAAQLSGSASATAVAKWMALTANATAPSGSDTTLTAEITTGGGGLVRVASTYAHTTSASTYTLTKTFTANGSDSLPVTIAKIGVFDASSTGNLVFETLLSATATLSASGDQLTVTETVTI